MESSGNVESAVVIIGGGLSGMCAAIDLCRQKTTRDIIIVEKSSGFGGTWRDSRFPGSCCDVMGHLYSYSFEQSSSWTHIYPAQQEILEYLTRVACKYGLFQLSRFNTTVEKCSWNNNAQKWDTLVVVNGGKEAEYGDRYTISSDFVISAVGQANLPKYPDIPGLSSFAGKAMHSARWDSSYEMKGKRIAIIGTGATAAQIVPIAAETAEQLTVLQRSPGWVMPRHDESIASWKKVLLAYFPPYRQWYRASWMQVRESKYLSVTKAQSHNAAEMRHVNQTMMKRQLAERPDLWDVFTPNYSPGCKRTVVSDDYYPTFLKPNVHLETRSIKTVTPAGILFEGETEETKFDLIILATGFRSLDFMYPIDFVGLHGRQLSEIWAGVAEAHKGVTVEDLPNFGMLYGPGTNLTHNSQIIGIEAQCKYLNVLIKKVLDARAQGKALTLTTRSDRLRAYNKQLQAALQESSFADPGCTSWWKTKDGLIPNNWSGSAVDLQKLLSKVDWTDFYAGGSAASAFKPNGIVHIKRVKEESFCFCLDGNLKLNVCWNISEAEEMIVCRIS